MSALTEQWRVSTRTGGNGNCVEVRLIDGRVEVRDTKDRTGPSLAFTSSAWSALTDGIKAGNL